MAKDHLMHNTAQKHYRFIAECQGPQMRNAIRKLARGKPIPVGIRKRLRACGLARKEGKRTVLTESGLCVAVAARKIAEEKKRKREVAD